MNNQIKTLAIIIAVLLSFNANAQIKVYSGGNTYIGGTGTTPLSILSVGGAGASSYTGYFYNPSTTVTSASGIRAENAAPTTGGIGVYSVSGIITPGTYSTCAGVIGAAYRSSAATGAYAYGVYGYAGNAYNGVNYGVYGLLLGSNNGAGVYASVYGPSIVGGKYAGYFDGIIYTNNSTAYKPGGGSWTTTSDERLKTAITPFADGMNVISQINPIKFKYNGIGGMPTDNYYYGVKAQDMQEIAPYTVGTVSLVVNQPETGTFNVLENLPADSSGQPKAIIEALSFNYDALIYVMINALKEQDSKINDLQNQIQQCCNTPAPKSLQNNSNTINESEQGRIIPAEQNSTQVVELSYADNAILYQNIPNPFGDETTINYYLPQTVYNAVMVFYNDMGQSIKEVALENKGNASVILKTSELASGIYSYSLVVEGKAVDTKKMLKNK